ncbi:conserved Plasmodium protein, unknown function [Plasmodium chabaudi chabaudi]|uniref:Uncharacterized protein n=1 Tax=Plasmodium chabaudi chabaudi TaxID=31271 RepID=A0A4V0KBQ3_PLACU|nr:conserved Plasmodium protein, unknown function [Plasmodium chabaudi chabaudi]VTZ70511.1 conserved Plasmodium protein, unknown function [Plasmodium chabaudi chabaudi]|eukprot:XP_743396.2 conserved Plasmodium protein, unknown function [Plasmodium chabaudi chabaudi]
MVRNKNMNSNVDLCVNHVDINNTYVDILNIHETLVNHIQAIAPQFYSLVETNFNLKNETNEIIKNVGHDSNGGSSDNNNNSYINPWNNNFSFKKNITHPINNKDKDNINFSNNPHIYNLYTNNYIPSYYNYNSATLNTDEISNKHDEYNNYEISDKNILLTNNLLYKKNKTEQIIKLKEKNDCFINTTYGNYDSINKRVLKNTDEQKKQLYECSNICKTAINIDHVNNTIYSRQLAANINDSNAANSENYSQMHTSQKNKEYIKNIQYPTYYLNLNGQDQIIDNNINDIVSLGKQVRNCGTEYLGGCNVTNFEKEIKISENMEKYLNCNDHNNLKMGTHSKFDMQYCTNYSNLKKNMIKINNIENCLKNTCISHNYMNKSGKNEKYGNVHTLNSDENGENNLDYEHFFPNNLNSTYGGGKLEAFGTKISKYDINPRKDIKKYNEINNSYNFPKNGQQIYKPPYYNNCDTNDDTDFPKDNNHYNETIPNICNENNLFDKLNKENYIQMAEEIINYVHAGKMQFDFLKNETNSRLSTGDENNIYKFESDILFDHQNYSNMENTQCDNYYSNHSSKEDNTSNEQDSRTNKYDDKNNNQSNNNDTTNGGGIGIGLNNKNTSSSNDDGNDDDDKSRDGDKQNCNYHEIDDEEEDKNENNKKNQDDEINDKQNDEMNNKENSNEQIVTHTTMNNSDNNNNNIQTNGHPVCDPKNGVVSKANGPRIAPNDNNNNSNNNYAAYNKNYTSDSAFMDAHTYDRNADTGSVNNFVDPNVANNQENLNLLNKHNNATNMNEGNYYGNDGRASYGNRNSSGNVNFPDHVQNRFSKSSINNMQILNGNKNENSFRNVKKNSINDTTMNVHNYNNEVAKDFSNTFPGKYSGNYPSNYSSNISPNFPSKFSNNDMHNTCDNIYNNYNINTNDQNSKCINDISKHCVESDLIKFTSNTYVDIHKIIKNDDMLKMEFTKMEDCFKNVPLPNKISSIDGIKVSGDNTTDPNLDKMRINNKINPIGRNGINTYNGGSKGKSKNNSKDNDMSRMYDNYKQLLTLDDTMIDGYNNQNFDELYFLQNNNIHPNVLNNDMINDSVVNNNIEKIIDIMNINNENIINKNMSFEGSGNMIPSIPGGTGFVGSPADVANSHLASAPNQIMINNRSNCNSRDNLKNPHNNISQILQQNAYIQGKDKKRKINCINANSENPCGIINKLDSIKDCGILKEFDDNKSVNPNNGNSTRYNKDKKKIYQKMDIRMLNKTVQKNKEICTNCYIHYDHSKSSYILTFINRKQKKQRKIFPVEPNEKDEPYIIKIINYINKLKEENKIYGVNANGNMKEMEEGKNSLEYNKQPLVDFSNNPHRSNLIKPVINNVRIDNTIDNNKRNSIYGIPEGNRNNNYFDARNSSNLGVYINPKPFPNAKPIHNEQQYGEDGNLIIKKKNNNTGLNNMRSGNNFTKQYAKMPYIQPNNMNYAHNDIANMNNRGSNFIKPLNYFDNIPASQNMDFMNYNMVNNTCAEEKQPINMFYDHDNNNNSGNGNVSKQVDENYVADMNIIHNMNPEIANNLNGGINQNMRMPNINYVPNINENCNRINSVPLHMNHNMNNHFHTNMNDINNNAFGNNFYDNVSSDVNGKNNIYPFSNMKGMNIMNANNNPHSSISSSGCGTIPANPPAPNNSIQNNQHNNTNNLLVNQNDEYHSTNIMNNMNYNMYSGNISNNDDSEMIKNYNNIINDYQRNMYNSGSYGAPNSMESILSLRGGSVHNNE